MRHVSLVATLAVLLAASTTAQLQLRRIATGMSGALYATAPSGDTERLFVVTRSGLVHIVRNGVVLPVPFLDLQTLVWAQGERGLLGLAFHPRYATNRRFFVNYTRLPDGATMLVEYRASTTNPDVADPNSATVVLGPIAQPADNHNGGCLQFGPDGYLYVGMGDGGAVVATDCTSQDGSSLLGKMLRLDVDTPGNLIPPTNPFIGDPAWRDEIWAAGLRNPWRFSFDRLTGDLVIGDVGGNVWEEIDFQPAGSAGGQNYGWKVMEGPACHHSTGCPPGTPPCMSPLFTGPIHSYDHTLGCGVVGGYVYRGCAIPSLYGRYVFADICSSRVWSMRIDNGVASDVVQHTELGTVGMVTSFGEVGGELYLTSLDGRLRKLEWALPTATDLGFGTIGGNGMRPRFSVCGVLEPLQSAELRLDGAAPTALAALALSTLNQPVSIPPFGVVVPNPIQLTLPSMTDIDGAIRFTINGGIGPGSLFGQFAVLDAGGPGGLALSNALELHFR